LSAERPNFDSIIYRHTECKLRWIHKTKYNNKALWSYKVNIDKTYRRKYKYR